MAWRITKWQSDFKKITYFFMLVYFYRTPFSITHNATDSGAVGFVLHLVYLVSGNLKVGMKPFSISAR